MKSLALLFGGRSAEHSISIASARFVAATIDRRHYDLIPIYITDAGAWHLAPRFASDPDAALDELLEAAVEPRIDPSRPGLRLSNKEGRDLDFVFPMLHGTYGEDGTIQGLLDVAGLPYAGCGVAASAVAMDKELAKRVFAAHELPQTNYVTLRDGEVAAAHAIAQVEDSLSYPLFVKPANLGSSVGMSKAHDRHELAAALTLAASYDRKVVVEQGVSCREFECALLGNEEPRASVVGEVVPANEYYDFDAKYTAGRMEFAIPAAITAAQHDEIAELARAAFRAIDGSGFARCDVFIENDSGRVLINEINTIPGMTPMSAFPRLWEAAGVGNDELIETIIRLGEARHDVRRRLRTSV